MERAPPSVAALPRISFGSVVRGVAHLLCPPDTIELGAGFCLIWPATPLEFGKFRRRSELRRHVERLAVEAKQGAEFGLADARGVLQHGLEDRLQLAGDELMTRSTSAVAVCCSSDCRNSLSSRVFSMAMTAWAAKFVSNSICLSVNGRTSWR